MKMQRYTAGDLARLEREMERRWHELAMAEQRGVPVPALERMYDVYLFALDEYIRCQRARTRAATAAAAAPAAKGA